MAKKNIEKENEKKVTKKVKNKKGVTKKTENKNKETILKGVSKELKLVKWPSFKEILKNTIATIVLCLFLVAFFEILNIILAFVKGLFN